MLPHRLVAADGVKLSGEHHSCEGEEEEGLHAEEDHQHHRHGGGEVTALWTHTQVQLKTQKSSIVKVNDEKM